MLVDTLVIHMRMNAIHVIDIVTKNQEDIHIKMTKGRIRVKDHDMENILSTLINMKDIQNTIMI